MFQHMNLLSSWQRFAHIVIVTLHTPTHQYPTLSSRRCNACVVMLPVKMRFVCATAKLPHTYCHYFLTLNRRAHYTELQCSGLHCLHKRLVGAASVRPTWASRQDAARGRVFHTVCPRNLAIAGYGGTERTRHEGLQLGWVGFVSHPSTI